MKMHELISETNIEWKEEYGIGVGQLGTVALGDGLQT